MCIACRKRELQSRLIRIQHTEGRMVPYSGRGRSMYLCHACSTENRQIKKISKRYRLDEAEFKAMLKELDRNG